jgi:hypothetical protein
MPGQVGRARIRGPGTTATAAASSGATVTATSSGFCASPTSTTAGTTSVTPSSTSTPREIGLYPELDPTYATFGGPTAAWEEFVDEDALEWLRFIHGAAEFFDDRQGDLRVGEPLEWRAAGVIRLALEDDLMKLTIGSRLVYADEATDRDRYLKPGEIEDVFLQLVGDLDDDLWQAHVPPYAHGYVNYLFVPPRPDAGAWLDARIAELVAAKPRRGSDPSRV